VPASEPAGKLNEHLAATFVRDDIVLSGEDLAKPRRRLHRPVEKPRGLRLERRISHLHRIAWNKFWFFTHAALPSASRTAAMTFSPSTSF
jgi:hypothetical protein